MTKLDDDDIAAVLAAGIGVNDPESTVTQYLDTGYPPLNVAMSSRKDGGFPVKRIVELAGPPSAGKTALATRAMAAAQKMGGIAGFHDHERSFSTALAPNLGLNISPARFIFRTPKTFEESLDQFRKAAELIRGKKLIDPEAPLCWVFDSLASMVPWSAMYDNKDNVRDATGRNMNDNTALARATSAHMPALAQQAEEYNASIIFLNQIRTKLGVMYGDPRTTPGGEAPKFYASTRIYLGASQIKDKNTKEVLGQEVTANVIKNKVARPFLAATWTFAYEPDGTGRFDIERSMIDFLVAEGVIAKARPGYILVDGTQYTYAQAAKKYRDEGRTQELINMMPADYEPPVVAVAEADMSSIKVAEKEEEAA